MESQPQQPQQPQPSPPTQIFCPNCRGGNPPGAPLCQWCGFNLVQPMGAPQQQSQYPPQYPPQYAYPPQPVPKRRSLAGILFGFVVLLCVIASLAFALGGNRGARTTTGSPDSSDKSTSGETQPGAATQPETGAVAKIGQPVEVGYWRVTVENVEKKPEIEWSGFGNKEQARGIFVEVHASTENTTNRNASVNSFDWKLVDSQGATYDAWTEFAYFSYASHIGRDSFNTEIPPRTAGKLVAIFEVAKNATGLVLVIEKGARIALE